MPNKKLPGKCTFKFFMVLLLLLNGHTFLVKAQKFSQQLPANSNIPDNKKGFFAKIKVEGLPEKINGNFGLESVCLSINHTYDAQIDIYLVGPDGTNVEISTNNGAFGQNYNNTCFNMTATEFISSVFSFNLII